ncbi:MAG: hypothetical protein ACKVYV_05635 [Limisphaerales bacterium]
MTRLAGVHSFTFGRLTLDGAGRAQVCLRIERDPRIGLYSSDGRIEDVIFRGAAYGLYNTDWDTAKNDMDAKYSVLRCHFLGLTQAGVRIEPGNGFDCWLRHCRFERCRIGALNNNGDFRVHQCVFIESAVADIQIAGHRNGGIRGNYSRGSDRLAQLTSSYVTVDPNRIIDPVQTDAIRIETSRGTLNLDNEIRSRADAALARVENGGRLFLSDLWFEGGLKEPRLIATGAGVQPGEVAVQGCFVFQPAGERFPALLADGFAGRFSVLAGRTVGATLFTNDCSRLDYAGVMGHAPILTNSVAPRNRFLIEGDPPDLATIVAPELRWLPEGITGYDAAYLRQQMEFSRATRPALWAPPTRPDRTAVRLHRVSASIRVLPAAP